MNKINVLYKNLNFKNGSPFYKDLAEDLDTPLFASDVTLSDLLQKASISTQKNDSNTKVKNKFKKHPRYITDDSIISMDEPLEPSAIFNKKVQSAINKITYKDLATLPCSETTSDIKQPNIKIDSHLHDSNEHIQVDDKKKTMPKAVVDNIADDVLGVKLKPYLLKINAWQLETRKIIQSGITPVESSEDYYRRQRRSAEFASRFSRNYLYQLGRQLIELRRHAQKPSLSRPGAARNLTNACQTVLQAIQAYCNYIPTAISTPAPDHTASIHGKFCDLMKDTSDLCRIIKKLGYIYCDIAPSLPHVEEIESNCKLLSQLIEEIMKSNEEIEQKPIIKPKIKPSPKETTNNLPGQKHTTMESRLAMYSVAFKKPQQQIPVWKKNAEKLAKQRFPPQVRRTKQKPIHPSINENIRTFPDNKKKRNVCFTSLITQNNSSINSLEEKINEDTIQTMVQLDAKNHALIKSPRCGMRSRVEPLLRTLVEEVAAEKEDNKLGHGVCDDMLTKLKELLETVQQPTPEENREKPKQELVITVPQSHITVSGPRNSKLVCIRDASMFDPKPEIRELPLPTEAPKILAMLPFIETNFQEKRLITSKANLPKSFTVNILQYKLNFHKYSKHLMLYKKTSNVLPWVLTEKLADSLFDHLLISVLHEINLNTFAQKLYLSEFETY